MASTTLLASSPFAQTQKSAKVSAVHLPTPPSSPPLPTPRTITELISVRAKQLPEEPILGYPSEGIDYVEYTFSQLDTLSLRASQLYSSRLPLRTRSDEDAQVVALLGVSNLDYVITALALTRLGFTVLFLSTRISEVAYLSLLGGDGLQPHDRG